MKRVSDGSFVAKQTHEALREIGVVRDRPQAESVAWDDQWLAPAESCNGRVTLSPAVYCERDHRISIGQLRPDDRHGKRLFAIRSRESILSGDLVARVVPKRILEWGGFGEQ